jgi:hypothetical protein
MKSFSVAHPMQFIIKLSVVIAILIFASVARADKSVCSDVLVDGTKANTLYRENSEYRRLLETKLVNMTFQQVKTDTSLTGNIPIGDIVLGAGYNEKTFEDYKSYLRRDTSLNIESSRSVDVMLSTGDPGILSAWSVCMQNRSGFSIRFKDAHARSAVLVLQWFPAAGVAEVKVAQDYKLPSGVLVTSGKDFLDGTRSIVAGTNHEVKLELPSPETTLALTFNVVDGDTARGADSAFLPSRMNRIRETRPYEFNVTGGVCSTTPTIYLDARRHSGTVLPTVTYCSSLKDGWRFSKGANDYNVTTAVTPSFVPSTQIANAPVTWTGDDQFNISLGCSSSTDTDIQCSATTRLAEERYVWRPWSD